MKVLVVGAGLMGSGIANRFAHHGASVRVFGPRRNSRLLQAVSFVHGRIEIGSCINELLDGVDVVVDAATSHVPATVHDSPTAATVASLGASGWLAEQAVSAGVGCLTYVSSGGTVYGPAPFAHREDDCPAPISSYGAMKLAAEQAITAITYGTSTRTVYVRAGNAYGPGQNLARQQGIIGVALRDHLNGEPITLFADKSTVRDFIYVDDVGDLCVKTAETDFAGPINAGSGHACTLEELLDVMAEVTGTELKVVHGVARPFDIAHSELDISLARALGWEPRVSLREGLRRTWEWIEATGGDS